MTILFWFLFLGLSLAFNSTLLPRQQFEPIQVFAIGLVAPIHIALIPMTGKVVFLERVDGGQMGTTHSQEFDYATGYSRPLNLPSDTFCSAGYKFVLFSYLQIH